MSEIIINDNEVILYLHTADGAYRHLMCWLAKQGAPSDICADAGCLYSELAAVTKERDEAINAIKDFVSKSQWCADIWKNQDHIRRLFDIAKK